MGYKKVAKPASQLDTTTTTAQSVVVMDGVSQISVLGFFEVYFIPIEMGLRQVE